jgi:stage II sporulation protein Q
MSQDQQNKPTGSNQTPEKTKTNRAGWKRFLGKKWAFPAIYMSAAAIILTFMWWYQDPGDLAIDPKAYEGGVVVDNATPEGAVDATTPVGEDAVAVTTTAENMKWPVGDPNMIDVIMGFYDEGAADEVKASSVIEFNEEWFTHSGVDITHPEGATFDVTAALSGKVTLVEENSVVGLQVEIAHDNGLVTVYQSLGEVSVKQGDTVQQGQMIGKAGRNVFEKDHGVHVHFEVRQDGNAVNPDQFFVQQ